MNDSSSITQEALDSSQYQADSIKLYERVYGRDFVSPGGISTAREMIGQLALPSGSRVLDVGCGLGGSAFVMATEFDLVVDGIDLSRNMLELANKKLEEYGLAEQVQFEWGDCLHLDKPEHYDAIYSRDVFLHIRDKHSLFTVLKNSLNSPGKMLFTDYCCGEKPWSSEFSDYVEDRGYFLHTVKEYAALIEQAGFREVHAEDISDRFLDILDTEIEMIEQLEIKASQRDELRSSWQQKRNRCEAGDHRWGLFTALK